jgi:polysaccharide export outer membrane protein
VTILRENSDGSKRYISVNLNDKNIIYTEAYYLEQNDVVYVAPNKSKSNSSHFGAAESFGISALSILFSFSSLLITILK